MRLRTRLTVLSFAIKGSRFAAFAIAIMGSRFAAFAIAIKGSRFAAFAIAIAISACATAGDRPREPVPPVIPEIGLCKGTPEDPKGERDPACAPPASHEPVELVNHLAGCRAGLRGPAEFRLGDQLLATLRPGEKKSFNLPRGDVVLTITEGGHSETRALSLGGTGPLLISVGCGFETFVGGLQPLVLEGAHGTCENAGTVKVRAGGLELEVGKDQVQTLFLPRGSHIVKVGGVDRTIQLGLGGALVPLVTCGTASP